MNNFDDRAATWDDPAKIERAQVIAEAISSAIDLDGSQRLLEYGAGTGLVTQALRSKVGPVTLVDTSEGMREVMRAKIAAGELTDARVWNLDLATTNAPDELFDVVVTVLTLHHVQDIFPVLVRFSALVDDGGWLCIADLDKEDGSFHGAGFDGHNGFDHAELQTALEAEGFVDVEFRPCHQIVRDTGEFPMFLATCRMPVPGS